jgi:hypothetical protein
VTALDVPDAYEEPEPDEDGDRPAADGYLKSESHAWWAARTLRDITQRRADIERAADAEIGRIRDAAERAIAPLAFRQRWFSAILEDYARRIRAADPRQKRVTTPYGYIQTTRKAAGFDVDTTAALQWAANGHTEFLHTTARVLKSELVNVLTVGDGGKVYDTITGDEVDWATPTPETVTAVFHPDLPEVKP